MAGISSEDKQRAANLVVRLDALQENARQLPIPSQDKLLERIVSFAGAIRAEYTYKLLSQLDVDVLSPCGFDTAALRRTGCDDVATLAKAFRAGKSSVWIVPDAKMVSKVVQQVYQSTFDRVPCLIDASSKPKVHGDLLAEVYLADRMPAHAARRDALMRETDELAPYRDALSNIPGFFGNLFMGSAQREQITSSIAQLEERLPILEAHLASINDDVDGLVSDAHTLSWQDYEANPSHYNQKIVALTGSPSDNTLPTSSLDLLRSSIQLDKRVHELEERVKDIHIPTERTQQTTIKEQADAVREARVMGLLAEIDLSALQGAGITIWQLRNKGYRNIADLRTAYLDGKLKTQHINQSGSVTQAVLKIHDAAFRVTPFVIDESRRPSDQGALLGSILKLWDLPALGKTRRDLGMSVKALVRDMTLFSERHAYAESLFMHQNEIVACEQALQTNEAALQRVTAATDELTLALSPSDNRVWMDYLVRKDAFRSTLRQVAQIPAFTNMPVVDADLALSAHNVADRLDKALGMYANIVLPTTGAERKELLELVRDVKKQDAKQRLDGIDVDVLAHGNVRVGPLKTAGFNTVGSLYGKSVAQLSRYPRVTYDAAEGVVRAVDDIYRSAVESARCRIDAEGKPSYQTPLVKGLYLAWRRRSIRQQLDEIATRLGDAEKGAPNLRSKYDYLDNIVMTQEQRQRIAPQVGHLEKTLPPIETSIKALRNEVANLPLITNDEAWLDFEHNAASYYAMLEELGAVGLEETTGGLPKKLVDRVASFKLDTSNLNVTLRRYQRFGAQYALHQAKTLIGDEMGLGKTVEAIATMAHLYAKGERYFMVVCPLSVLINWSREVPKHSRLRATPIHGSNRDHSFYLWCLHGGVAVTTYETISRLNWDQLGQRRIAMLVADEAHYVKNPDAKRTRALVEIALARSDRALFLSGTPLENKVEEMNALIGHLNPGLVSRELGGTTYYNPIKYRQAIAPVYLRRKREDVLSELPRKIEEEDWCELTREDLSDYRDALVMGNFSSMRRVGWRHDNPRRSAKGQRLLEICEEAKANGSKVLVFSYFLDTIAKVQRLVGNECIGAISGRIPAARRQELIDEFTDSDKTVLVSQVTAGGVGLNIQAANIIVFCEPQIKPSIEDQAISRSYRMGQVRTVVVHRLLMSNTVDERVTEILERKRAEFAAYADESQMGMESLAVVDTTAILEIIEDERRRYGIRGGKAATTGSNSSDGV